MKHPANVPLVYSPHYSIPWDPKHRFPMAKYRLVYEHLVSKKIALKDNVFISSPTTRSQLSLAHDPEYIDKFIDGKLTGKELKELGLIWSEKLVRRTLTAVGGSIQACKLALDFGISCHLAGGTHHAFANKGGGFCVFNDIAVAAKYLVSAGYAKQVLIIDCDVHQGDGSAHILANDASCFTCSIHAKSNFPFKKMASDLDIELEKGTDDAAYLEALDKTLAKLITLTKPDFVIYDGGSDVHKEDRLGHLELSDEGIRQRDYRVIRWARSQSLPIACLIGGGYDHDHQQLALRQALLPETAQHIYQAERFNKSPLINL